jgi:pimeloyl-ACP methyl ester carboxylesterase
MKTPVKVIVGEYDPGLNEGVMRETWMRWYPNARLEVMRNAGHYPMDEAPVALATSIERFLDALPQE